MVKDKTLLDFVYPIGSIYLSISSTNPGTLIGGTWVSWGQGRVPVGVDTTDSDFNSVEKTGGEKKHTMTIAELVEHDHDVFFKNTGTKGNSESRIIGHSESTVTTAKTGGGQPFNIQQQYITCYMWKRVA